MNATPAPDCDKYAVPATCNLGNPPAPFTPPPAVHDAVTTLSSTGLDPMMTWALLSGGALALAVGALLVVLELRRRQVRTEQ